MRKVILLLVLFFTINLSKSYTQSSSRTIVLINGTAHIVDLSTNGSILAQYQSIPDYFNSTKTNEQIIAEYETKGLNNLGQIELYTDYNQGKMPELSSFKKSEIVLDENKQYIAFSRGRAILNQKAVDQIRLISDAYQRNEIREIIINSYHDDSVRQRILAKNRSKAISDLLNTFGVQSKNIQINMPYGQENNQLYFVYLSFVK